MRAVVVDRFMSPDELTLSELPEPEPADGEVLVSVKAAGCNFFDTLIVQGKYQVTPEFPFTPGGEVAGVVERATPAVARFRPGDRVMARLGRGGFAERVSVSESALEPIPEGMSFEQAAAFPIVYGTAYAAVVLRGGARAEETVLVTAAGGGVGLASIQVAKAVGARVIALCGKDKMGVARDGGADEAVDYRADGWVERVKELSGGRGVDVIVENVGGEVFDGCTRCIAWAGRLVVSGFASGRIPEVKVNRIMLKHISIVGLHWGPMADHEPEAVRMVYRELASLYERGLVRPLVSRTYEAEHVAQALEALSNRQTVGKVVVTF